MKKINLMILMMIFGVSVYSIDESTLLKTNVLEREIKKIFVDTHSQLPNGEKLINCELEINLFEESGLVSIVGKNIVEINELIIKSENGFFDEYFEKVVEIIKKQMEIEDYEVDLIFVTEEENRLIVRKYYTI